MAMDNFRAFIKKSPAPIVQQTLRTTLIMPQVLADDLLAELTMPSAKQKKWIKKINNSYWKGVLIAPGMKYESDAEAIRRLRTADIVIFEIHGGGFRVGHSAMYMAAFTNWIEILRDKHGITAVIMSIEYGLAPEHKYPGPIIEVVNAYKHLVEHLRVPPWKVVASGDSAGGAIGIEALIRYYAPDILNDLDAPRTNFRPMLAGIVASSPVVSDKMDTASWKKYGGTDIVSKQLVKLVFKEFFDIPRRDPSSIPLLRIAELRSGFDRFMPPNVLAFIGEREVFHDHVVELLTAAENDGINVQLNSEKYAHDWFLIREIVKRKDKKMLDRYDEMFADFCVRSVAEATEKAELARVAPTIDVPLTGDDKGYATDDYVQNVSKNATHQNASIYVSM